MKVNFDLNLNNKKQYNNKAVSFEGYNTTKNSYGELVYEFNYPYDASKYDCYLEICKVAADKHQNYYITEGLKNQNSPDGNFKLNPGGNKIDLADSYGLREKQAFAYHYVLIPKGKDRNDNSVIPTYKIDAGDFIDFRTPEKGHEIYNIVTANSSAANNIGAMKLLMPDFYNPAWTYDSNGKIIENTKYAGLRGVVKNFANKIGGNIAGIEKDVIDGKFNGYSKIISTPLFTDDDLSSHGYWNKNCMQIIQSLGNINNYASLQREMFKKGINFVSDGAYVNEGLEGIHFQNVLKWGEKSPYFLWFDANNLKDGAFTLGVFGKNNANIRHKVVNPKYVYSQDEKTGKISISINKKYKANQPTFFQIYNNKVVSKKLAEDPQYLIKEYDIINPENPLDINTHNDIVIPYAFEIDPDDYNENIKKLIEHNSNVSKQPPVNMHKAIMKAVDEVFPSDVDAQRNIEVKNILDKATEDVEEKDGDKKYAQKIDLIMARAKKEYDLKMSDAQEQKLTYNLKKLHSLIKIDSYMGTRFLSKFRTFELEEKIESKISTWDANTDIPKLKYLYTKEDTKYQKLHIPRSEQEEYQSKVIHSNYGVQDYAIQSGMYWTEKTSDILNLYVAQQLTGIDANNPTKAYINILNNIKNGNFPKKLKGEINPQIVDNVLSGIYELKPLPKTEYKKYLIQNLMKLPLDSIEFGDNLASVLASPYISKRAIDANTLGKTRYEMYVNGNPHLLPEYESTYKRMDRIYEKELSEFANEIINNLNATLPEDVQIYSGYKVSTYGKYVMPYIAETIAKYAIIKALAPNTEVKVDKKTGEISYDYEALKKTTLQSIGVVSAAGPEDEADQVISKLRSGLKKLNKDDKKLLVDAIFKSLKGTNENSFMLAEMITDRLNAGLDWRIDATKDIGDMNALKAGTERLDEMWSEVTNFWKNWAGAVYSKNRNAYIVAEITDEGKFFSASNNSSRKYANSNEMVKKLLRESGIKSTANYSSYFSSILNLFANHFDNNDKQGSDGFNPDLSHRMHDKSAGFFNNMPYEAILNSYNFIGNHDKPRVLHGLVVDSGWYRTKLGDIQNKDYRNRAYRILTGTYDRDLVNKAYNESDQDFKERIDLFNNSHSLENASGKALAMAEALHAAFHKMISEKYANYPERAKQLEDAINKALANLAKGSYKGNNFEADGFGVTPVDVAIDLVIDEVQYMNKIKLSDSEITDLKNITVEKALAPALKKLQAMMEVLTVLPGMPTLYAGDDIGATGYESETKNLYLRNRGYIHNEWLDERNTDFKFIQQHYDKLNKTLTMRNRPELHALNDGAPFLLDIQNGQCDGRNIDLSAILRQGTDNSVVISLINTSGINHTFDGDYNPHNVTLDSINLNSINNDDPRKMTKGLTPGTILYNAKDKQDRYVVRELNGRFFIKKLVYKGNGNYADESINFSDPTLTLYSKPPKIIGPVTYPKIDPKKINTNNLLVLV